MAATLFIFKSSHLYNDHIKIYIRLDLANPSTMPFESIKFFEQLHETKLGLRKRVGEI